VPNSHRLIIIVKPRKWDEAAWKKLLLSYAYALYELRKEQSQPAPEAAGEVAHP